MAFEFPASPTTGQVSNGFQWDGEKWKGGQPSGPQKETFIDYSGKSQVDVAVPTWAKAARITASVTPTATGQFLIRVSLDGSTFLAGASDYTLTAPWHYSSPPTYTTLAQGALSALPLTLTSDVLTVAHTSTAEISLVRPSTGDVFSYKSQGTSFHTAGQLTTVWHTGFVNVAPSGSALTIKALRFLGLTGKPGSSIHIQWLGDDAQVPISNAIADAPSDGGEYVRVNGVWRLSKQSLSNVGGMDFVVPATAKAVRFSCVLWNTVANQALMRISSDGTTFYSGVNDYTYSGYVHYVGSATPGIAIVPATNQAYWPLHGSHDNAQIPAIVSIEMPVAKGTGGPGWGIKYNSGSYNSNASMVTTQFFFTGWSNSAAHGFTQLKAIRFGATMANFAAGSYVNAEWLY